MNTENSDAKDSNEELNEATDNIQSDLESSDEAKATQDAQTDENAEEQDVDWKAYAEELESKLSAAQAKIDDQKDSVLRAIADGENARRRAEQEIDKARKFALEKFAKELLTVVDNLERATQAADAENEAVKPLLEGVELTQKSFISTFENAGLKVIDPQGEAFDPEQHQAMSMQETDEVPPNTVIAVMQKGYLLSERLLRPAMVMVSRGTANSVDTQA